MSTCKVNYPKHQFATLIINFLIIYKKLDRLKNLKMKTLNEKKNTQKIADFADKSLLIVDDDNPLRDRLARAMEKKGFKVFQAQSVKEGLNQAKNTLPAFAVVDLRLGDGSGLELVKELKKLKKESKVVMLTGYGNALLALPETKAVPPENPMSADRVKWEHIHRVFELCNRNVSETARRLKMHRRTLQRILSKRSPR